MKHIKIRLFSMLIGSLMLLTIGCRKDDSVNDKTKDNKIFFNPTITYGSVTDIDSNIYKTVTISGHEWMAENLKVTHYNDSSEIPNVTYDSEWFSQFKGAYCWMNNDIDKFKGIYGALYNFYAVVDNRNLCPVGWHVPSYSEWTELIDAVGGEYVAGAKLKEEGLTHWMYKNNSDNVSGFSALPGGIRGVNGYFSSIGQEGYWWTSTAIDQTYAINCNLSYNNDTLDVFGGVKMFGFSVRCVKDEISVKTLLVSDIKQTTATSGGNIISKNGATITERGVCWSTNQNPTIADSKTSDGNGIGVFASYMTELNLNTTYYLRAYAINGGEVFYGNELSYTTLPQTIPTITTNKVVNIKAIEAASGGIVSDDGGLPIIARGICWSSLPNPTVDLSTKTVDGEGIGAFKSKMSSLTKNTFYYLKAYATNSLGTSYGDEVTFETNGDLFDIDGNYYSDVTIGNQVWMAENLKTTKYRDGTSIPNITNYTTWRNQTTGAYCWYNNNISNKVTYGALYNYYSVVDSRNLCPTGWHIPSNNEWNTLINYLGGTEIAGEKLKEEGLDHWLAPNTNATNESGFTGLPGGIRSAGYFSDIGTYGFFWCIDSYDSTDAWFMRMYSYTSISNLNYTDKTLGISVRCLKDQ